MTEGNIKLLALADWLTLPFSGKKLIVYNNFVYFVIYIKNSFTSKPKLRITMNKIQIGENAGLVWNRLKDNRHWEYDELKAATGLSDRDLNAAIGWLAREDKIDFDMNNEDDKIFLTVNVYIG